MKQSMNAPVCLLLLCLVASCKPKLAQQRLLSAPEVPAKARTMLSQMCQGMGKQDLSFHGSHLEIAHAGIFSPRQDTWDQIKARLVAAASDASPDGEIWQLDRPLPTPYPGCMRQDTKLTALQLGYLLGCHQANPCQPDPDLCTRSTCLAMSSPLDFRDDPGLGNNAATMIALTSNFTCEPVPDRPKNDHVIKAEYGYVGSDAYGPPESTCRELINSAANGLICAWTGQGYAPHRIADGHLIGSSMGYKKYKDCFQQVKDAKSGFVTAWDGSQFLNYSIETKSALGTRGNAKYAPVADDLDVIAKDHICAWTGAQFEVFHKSGEKKERFGAFKDQKTCHLMLKSVDYMEFGEAGSGHPLDELDLKEASLEDMLQLWYPDEEVDDSIGYTLEPCHDPRNQFHIVKTDERGELLEPCRLDTFYSYGPLIKLAYFLQYADKSSWRELLQREIDGAMQTSPLFLTQSPSGSFGYGLIPMRVKMRSDIRYKLVIGSRRPSCSDLSETQRQNTLIVFKWLLDGNRSGVDYILCSMNPVHSFSFGTKRAYDEMVKDIRWILSEAHDFKDTELYYKVDAEDQYLGFVLDGNPFNREVLTSTVRNILSITRLSQENRIIYNVSATPKTAEYHFSTTRPIYYNQK